MFILASKRAYIALFGAKKSDMGGETESYMTLFDAEKCDIGTENACFRACFTCFSVCWCGPTPFNPTPFNPKNEVVKAQAIFEIRCRRLFVSEGMMCGCQRRDL
ncbi:MAG: hypothetical protein DRI57_12325 [Deltaproteobacteria bacterium]|nr:MAG: hypothetical protein DRI57_12325 [Deltaproteobacteria bacterium]